MAGFGRVDRWTGRRAIACRHGRTQTEDSWLGRNCLCACACSTVFGASVQASFTVVVVVGAGAGRCVGDMFRVTTTVCSNTCAKHFHNKGVCVCCFAYVCVGSLNIHKELKYALGLNTVEKQQRPSEPTDRPS